MDGNMRGQSGLKLPQSKFRGIMQRQSQASPRQNSQIICSAGALANAAEAGYVASDEPAQQYRFKKGCENK